MFGGRVSNEASGPTTSAECFDPRASDPAWHPVADLPVPGCACAASLGDSRHVYVLLWGSDTGRMGGSDGGVWRYDVGADRYERIAPLPLPEWYGFAVAADPRGGRLYVVGGSTKGRWTGSAFCIDASSGTWNELPPMKMVRRRTAAAAVAVTAR